MFPYRYRYLKEQPRIWALMRPQAPEVVRYLEERLLVAQTTGAQTSEFNPISSRVMKVQMTPLIYVEASTRICRLEFLLACWSRVETKGRKPPMAQLVMGLAVVLRTIVDGWLL
ncbi:unnamed protein product [Amoebophrya sp. A25]|nr:unnamed protein product [Amoebophrya sp. A25]|eukprot:GSA25T00018865001.1